WICDGFLPFIRRKWKLSTACTSGDRIRTHLIADLGSVELQSVTRDLLQAYLEQKAAKGLSFSVVDHLRWDLRAIFRLAVQDGHIRSTPAELLFAPRAGPRPSRRVLSGDKVQAMLNGLALREQLMVQLALFSGMRPGEIFALQWQHVAGDHVQVVHRVYRGQLDQPKNERSKRTVALSSSTRRLIDQWRRQQDKADPENLGVSFGKDHDALRARQRMAMADPSATENHWTGMDHVSDPAPHACESLPAGRHRSQARGRSTGAWAQRESRRLYGGGTGAPTTCRGGIGSLASPPFVFIGT